MPHTIYNLFMYSFHLNVLYDIRISISLLGDSRVKNFNSINNLD